MDSEKITWLANEIFTTFPEEIKGLKFHFLDCGCVCYQRVFPDGSLDTKTGIQRNAEDGACQVCTWQDAIWKERSLDEIIVYSSKFQVEEKGQQKLSCLKLLVAPLTCRCSQYSCEIRDSGEKWIISGCNNLAQDIVGDHANDVPQTAAVITFCLTRPRNQTVIKLSAIHFGWCIVNITTQSLPSGESRDEWLPEDSDMKPSNRLLMILGGFNIERHDQIWREGPARKTECLC